MTSLPFGEKATEMTQAEWPSSICSAAPVIASQSLTVRSFDPDTASLPSGEKATDVTECKLGSSVCSAASQFTCTFDFIWIQGGIYSSNCLLTILFPGAKTRAEQ